MITPDDGPTITLDQLLDDVLEYAPHEHVSVGTVAAAGGLRVEIHTAATAVAAVGTDADTFFGVNPVGVPLGPTTRRGGTRDVTRLAALVADLDVKPGACPDRATAYVIIDDIAVLLGTPPSAITLSGSGLHAYWPVDSWSAVQLAPGEAEALARRFGYLVSAVAELREVGVDTVSDLPRMMRAPGSMNRKVPGHPVPVTTVRTGGAPMTAEEVTERLDEMNVAQPDPVGTEVISDPTRWAFGDMWCEYAKTATQGWASDAPRGGRHQMAQGHLVRLACMWRKGCLPDEDELRAAITTVADRLAALRAGTSQPVGRYEVASMWAWAQDCASRKTNGQVNAELGHHGHGTTPPDSEQQRAANGAEKGSETPIYADLVLTRSALRSLPDPQPLIVDTLDRGTLALLYGKHGTAKTFLALAWAASMSTGMPWQGRASTQCRVLYVAAEGAFGLKGRVDAWEICWRNAIEDGQLDVLPTAVNLSRALDVANLAAFVSWGGYDAVFLDTLARCMVGADENSAKDCGIAVDAMGRLLASTPRGRGLVTGVHHAGKDGKTLRGSSAFEAAADTVYFTARDGAVITLEREKRKDGPELDRHEFRLDPIAGTGSMVLSAYRASPADYSDRGRRLLDTFTEHFAHTGASKAELRLVADMPNATFHRALGDLMATGKLVNIGTDKRPFYQLMGRSG